MARHICCVRQPGHIGAVSVLPVIPYLPSVATHTQGIDACGHGRLPQCGSPWHAGQNGHLRHGNKPCMGRAGQRGRVSHVIRQEITVASPIVLTTVSLLSVDASCGLPISLDCMGQDCAQTTGGPGFTGAHEHPCAGGFPSGNWDHAVALLHQYGCNATTAHVRRTQIEKHVRRYAHVLPKCKPHARMLANAA